MKYVVLYGGSALIAVITTICGYGYTTNGHFNAVGAILNVQSVIVWAGVVELLSSKK